MACERCPTCGGDTVLKDDRYQAVLPHGLIVQVRLHLIKEVAKNLSEVHQSRPGSLSEERLIKELLDLLKIKRELHSAISVDECRQHIQQQIGG